MKTITGLNCLAIAGALSILMFSSPAEAMSCLNDIDCPEAACGGQVCDYNKGMTCQPAGGAPKGSDGWCTTDSDCKCMGMGATCVGVYCSFTTAPAGTGGSSGGSGGVSGSGGSATGGTSATGGSSAPTGASGGTTGASGGTTGASGGTTGATGSGGAGTGPSSSSSGGCSVSGSGSASVLAMLLGLSALGLRRFRRRT